MTSPLNRNIAALTLSVQCETTWLRLRNALNGVQDALRDEKYRADQPRAPKGTPIGGQWIADPNSARRRTFAELTQFGILVGDFRYPDGSRLCIYDFGSQKWVMQAGPTLHIGCWNMMPQSSVFSLGTRLNDN